MNEFSYVGQELQLFSQAVNWKAYWRDQLAPFVHGSVLEVGAGDGNNAIWLQTLRFSRWVSLEPDPRLCTALRARVQPATRDDVVQGTLVDLVATERFDTILYIDVLEHIEDDRAELTRARDRLLPGGHLIVLSPAWQFLYSPFDAAIGHFRRYRRSSLAAAAPPGLTSVLIRYLDAAGMLASAGNRVLLRSSMPNARQIKIWDEGLVPISRRLDRLLGYRFGKSILGVWKK
jgi:2-polyprenyl-3-methyl-5-hydroxy-6-metoxy-1,4-benzoquinol methylase